MQQLIATYEGDDHLQDIVAELAICTVEPHEYKLVSGILKHKGNGWLVFMETFEGISLRSCIVREREAILVLLPL